MSTTDFTTSETTDTTEAAPETPDQPGAGEEQAASTEETDQGEEPQEEAEDSEPIEARLERRERELRTVREEAAKRRTQVRDLEAKLSEAKTQEDIEVAVAEYRDKVADLEKQITVNTLAAKHGLDENLTAILSKFSVEELEEQAAKLAVYAPKRPQGGGGLDDLSGGLNPGRGSVREGAEQSPSDVVKQVRRKRF